MAKPGPRPVPTPIKHLRGTQRADRMNDHEAKARVALPRCPAHLSGEAKKEWRRLGRQLAALGLMSSIDRGALAMYCQAWGRWVEAEEALKKYGMMVKSPSGFPMQSPYLAIANKAMEQMRALLTEFGMSPSSRTRVHAEPVIPEDDEMARLLSFQ